MRPQKVAVRMAFMSRSLPLRTLAVTIVVALPLLGMSSGVAAAKAPQGCHKTHSCKSGGGSGSGGGTGGSTPAITVQVDPNPLVETGPSLVAAVIQVETSPSLAGDPVDISSSQLTNACGGIVGFLSNTAAGLNDVTVFLDDDGNASVVVEGTNCAPGPSLIEADLAVAPFITATTTLTASPPVVTTAGVTGYPATSGVVTTGEVETGDSATSGDSDVYGVFYVETNPVYAEQPVDISSTQLQDRCGGTSTWTTFLGGTTTSSLDDDGNAVFVFFGSSCAAGPSTVIADVDAGSKPTYTTTFNVVAPEPTI
jgi:hypothetical protein